MSKCLQCGNKDLEISDLKGVIEFYKREAEGWRSAFNEQRGGEVFNSIQSQLADSTEKLLSSKKKLRI